MDGLIVAGGVPAEGDLLYEETQGKPKSLLELGGKPMVQWVLDAFCAANNIDNVVVVGLDETDQLSCSKPIYFLPDAGGMISNIRVGGEKVAALNPEAKYMVISSADIPTITGDMVDWVVETCLETEDDLYYNVISREVMEARFPGANRSYIKLKDRQLCGGDLNVAALWTVTAKEGLWNKLSAARKNVFKQAALVGYDTLLLLLLRLSDLDGLVRRVSNNIKMKGRAIECPYAEIAMDADKPHQLEILKRELEQRT